MPWKPAPKPEPEFVPHPGLDPFRGRAGRITNAHGRTGVIFVESSGLLAGPGGHLWWRRWSALHEFVILHVEYSDGRFDEFWLEDEELDEEIKAWERNEFHHRPRNDVYQVEWLEDDESARVRRLFLYD